MPDGETEVMPGADNPYLSIVVTARNDDHGGNLLHRMQAFTNGWINQARRYSIPSELIIVEWNPPADRPRLAEVLQWPSDPGPCQVRVIEVPAELHARFAHGDALPLYQMVAKNVGIRRARGEYVLATNIDILFSNELACFFAARRLKRGRMYRIDRHDAMSDIPRDGSIDDQLEYCRTHLIRWNVREGTYNVSPDGKPTLSSQDIASEDSGLLFGKGWLPVESYTAGELFRWAGQHTELMLPNPPPNASALVIELEPGPGTGNAPLNLEVIAEGYRVLAHVDIARRSRLRLPLPSPLPARLWFRVHQGGFAAEHDPRILNFRAFRLEWDRGAGGAGEAASVQSVGGRNFVVAAWFAMQHLIDRLAKGGRLVRLTVPVSPRLQRRLKMYIEYRGFVGMLRHSISHFQRRMSFQKSAAPGEDIFPRGAGISPGAGWQPLEDYRGETFRLAKDGAELVISAAAPGSNEIGLQVEPVDQAAVDVLLLDAAGKKVASASVSGLAFVKLPVERVPGRTQIFRLSMQGGSVRVFWCGWTGSVPTVKNSVALSQPWGAGWRWDPDADAMLATDGPVELVVRVPPGPPKPLFIDLEAAAPTDFEIRSQSGTRLAAGRAGDRAVHRLDLALDAGRTQVLELTASGPIRAFGCDWNEEPAAHPSFVHTNACGDFTLLAREHWFDLRGYPEFDLFSMNLDSIFCIAAHHGGAREQMLDDPMRIYHLEHATGSGWTPEGQAKLFERIRARGLSFVDNEEVLVWASQMNRLNSPMIFNHDSWGLADRELKETVPASRASDRQAGGK